MSTLETLEVPTPSSSLTLASIKQGIRLFAALWDVIRVWQGVKYGSAGKIEKNAGQTSVLRFRDLRLCR